MLTSWAVAALAFLLAAYLLPTGFVIDGSGVDAFLAGLLGAPLPFKLEGTGLDKLAVALAGAFALGVANAVVRPIVVLFAFPLTLMTLGLLLFVINGAMLYLATLAVPGKIVITHFGYAVVAALIISTVNTVAGWFLEK
jgi:putative membrane protein